MPGCLFLVELRDGEPPGLAGRLAAVGRWFAPVDAAPAVVSRAPWRLAGRIALGGNGRTADSGSAFAAGAALAGGAGARGERTGGPGDRAATVWWLEPPPAALRDAAALLAAGDADLRGLRTGLVAAVTPDRARLATGPCGATALYRAQGDVVAYSTHAVAAALLAGLEPAVDPAVLPAMLAVGGPIGGRGLLAGVRPVPPATLIDLDPRATRTREYWPRRERWAAVPSAEAHAVTGAALLRALDERLRDLPDAWLGLTGGLDSRVVAAAVRELGLPLRTYTWGHRDDDVAGAREIATTLGLRHERVDIGWHDAADGLRHIEREVRFNEGLGRMSGFGDVAWPPALGALVTGGGGETGRAFWWRHVGRNHTAPSPAQAARGMGVSAALRDAPRPVRRALQGQLTGLLADLEADGVPGWAGLDALYGEARCTQWARGMVHRRPAATLAAFMDVDVQRGLRSAPAQDRLTDGFHHWFLRAHAPALAPAPSGTGQRAGVPRAVRRAAFRLRERRAVTQPWGWRPLLEDRPDYAAWLRDVVLGSPLVVTALGAEWSATMRRAFDGEHDFVAAEAAITLTGPVALSAALGG